MAIAQQVLASGRGVNGSAFLVAGMNSSDDPMFIDDRAYASSMNTVNRGGVVQSRPGYRCLFTLPEGNLQGLCFYRPFRSAPFLVFVVDGIVYTSVYPFVSYEALSGIQFYRSAKQIYWSVATKSVQQEDDGTLTVIDPVRLLVMQDGGYSRAAFWDGSTSRHLDPGDDETPIGGPMVWSGDRLWVASENRLYASDISDPLKFTETTYLSEGGSFFTTEPITGLAEIPGLSTPQIAVFTAAQAYLFQSGIRDRSLWKTQFNPPFQSTLFPSVGCVSHRSIVSLSGRLWWMTKSGLTSFDSAQQAQVSSVLAPQDLEMAVSKGNLAPALDTVCSAYFENYGLFSVPSGHKWNRHTWAMDKAVLSGLGKEPVECWNSVWTGTNPVEWATGLSMGVNRIFHASVDADGQNRLWEVFTADRLDNGLPITSYLETKTHIDFSDKATGLDLKRFVYAEVTLAEIFGNVSVAIYWAGTRGRYKKIYEYNIVATQGQWKEGTDVPLGRKVYGLRPQSRRLRTPTFNPDELRDSDCSSCGIESDLQDHQDVGFSLLIVWSGRAAVRSYRIFADPVQEPSVGDCSPDETGETNVVIDQFCEGRFGQ